MMNNDVTLPKGTCYVVIDTDAYSGNFERELSGYACGAYDGRGHGEHESVLFLEEEGQIGEGIAAKLVLVPHDEYGDVYATLRATPGRINDGKGKIRDAQEGEKGWPAYESVAVFFERPLTETEMAVVKRRALQYAASPKQFTGEYGEKPFTILDVYMVSHTNQTKTVEERLQLA